MGVANMLCAYVWRGDRARRSWLIGFLDLLGAPASVFGLAHVGRGLNGGDELESDVGKTGDTDDATSDVAEDIAAEDQRAEEEVDWERISGDPSTVLLDIYLQTPRPMKENMNDACRAT
jgi:hypothetical protein